MQGGADARAFRHRWRAAALAATCAFLAPSPARAVEDEAGRPWARGTVMPSFGLGLGFSPNLTQISLGVGASYFVWHGLSFGLGLTNRFLIYSSAFKNRFPGVEDQIPTNIFRITPSAQYVFYRSRWFSPYVSAGVGPTFFNNQGGVHGHWNAGPGAFIGLGGPVFVDIGVTFSGMFTRNRCNDAFVYEAPSGERGRVLEGVCSFGWGPRVGLIMAFGGGRSRGRTERRRRSADPPRVESAPDNPMHFEPATGPQSQAEPPVPPADELKPAPDLGEDDIRDEGEVGVGSVSHTENGGDELGPPPNDGDVEPVPPSNDDPPPDLEGEIEPRSMADLD